ncbi:MAG: mobile mystery protein A [Geminicoccaceae bacterium]
MKKTGYSLMDRTNQRARSKLDQRLSMLRPVENFGSPPKGWIRAIRDALGMRGVQLARRMGMTPQSLQDVEKSEAAGSIRIETLRKAAAALDCSLVYALVPNQGLEETVANRARAVAQRELRGIAHSMALEDQAVIVDDMEGRINHFIAHTLKERDLWDDE